MKKIINIILLIICLIVIFMLSQDSGSSSSNKSDSIAEFIIDKISDITGSDYTDSNLSNTLDNCIFIVRKSAHFLEYMILGILMINVLKDYKAFKLSLLLIAILLCFLYACSDEVHQLFIPDRSGKILDVLIDTSGSCLGVLIYFIIYKKKNKRRKIAEI